MATITAYPDPIHGYVYLEIDYSDQPTVTQVRVYRTILATGEEELVRVHTQTDSTGEYIVLNGGTATLYDTEAPLDTPISYRTEASPSYNGVINANPYFETNTSDWTAGSAVLAIVGSPAHQGSFSMRVTPTGGVPASATTSGYAAVAGESYDTSAWFYATAGWATMSQNLIWLDSGGTTISTSTQAFVLAAGVWQLNNAAFTAPVGATQVQYRVSADGAPAVGNVFFTDETKLIGPLSTGALSDEVILASSGGLWLKDPLRPYNDRRLILKYNGSTCVPGQALYFTGLADESYGTRGDLPVVINKRNPIAVTRIRGGMATSLGVVARTFTDRDLLKETLAPGSVLFLQAPVQYGIEDVYMGIGDVTVARMSNDMRKQWRRFEIPFVEVDRPAGLMYGVLGSRWMDMCDVYPTFGAATAAELSWHAVMQGGGGLPADGVDLSWATWTSVVGEYATWTAVVAAVGTWTELVEG